jgi:hypothetical protein
MTGEGRKDPRKAQTGTGRRKAKPTTTANDVKVRHPSFAAAVSSGAALGSYDTPYRDVALPTWAAHHATLAETVPPLSPAPTGLAHTDLPAVHRLVLTDAQVLHYDAIVSGTGTGAWMDDGIAATRSKPGRPARFSARSVLVGLLACALDGQPMHLKEVADVLTHGISPKMQKLLGVRADTVRLPKPCRADRRDGPLRGGRGSQKDTLVDDQAAERAVGRTFARMVELVDPSNLPKNRRLAYADLAAAIRPVDETTRRQRQGDLDWVTNRIVQASWKMVPPRLLAQYRGSTCIDGTPIPLHSKKGTSKTASADPDGGLMLRKNLVTNKIVKSFHALEGTAVNGVDDHPGPLSHFPSLVKGITTDRPGVDPAGAARRVLAAIEAGGLGPTRENPALLAGDLLYPSMKADSYSRPAAEHHYKVVHDYKTTDLGRQGGHAGMAMVEGAWYCPAMLENSKLLEASKKYRAGELPLADYRAIINERRDFRMRTKTKATDTSPERLTCPAAGKNAIAVCSHKPSEERRTLQPDGTRADGRRQITTEGHTFPGGEPEVCKRDSVSVTIEQTPKHAQSLVYGTPEHAALYRLLRSSNEGIHGQFKDGAKEAVADPSRRLVRGKAAQTLLVAFQLFAFNVRKITWFMDESVEDPASGDLVIVKYQQDSMNPWADVTVVPDDLAELRADQVEVDIPAPPGTLPEVGA